MFAILMRLATKNIPPNVLTRGRSMEPFVTAVPGLSFLLISCDQFLFHASLIAAALSVGFKL